MPKGEVMKFLAVVLLVFSASAVFAANIECTNNDKSFPVTFSANIIPVGFSRIRIQINETKQAYPRAVLDEGYRPRPNIEGFVRWLVVDKFGGRTSFSFITKRVIKPQFHAVVVAVVVDELGYYRGNKSYSVDCVNNAANEN